MSWTLSRYIGLRFLSTAGAAFAVVFALIVLLNAIELLRRSSGDEIAFGDILSMALLQSPAARRHGRRSASRGCNWGR